VNVKPVRLLLTPIDVGGPCVIEIDGQGLQLIAEVGRHSRPVITLTNLRAEVEADFVESDDFDPRPGRTP
jgi:hypothetical protein